MMFMVFVNVVKLLYDCRLLLLTLQVVNFTLAVICRERLPNRYTAL